MYGSGAVGMGAQSSTTGLYHLGEHGLPKRQGSVTLASLVTSVGTSPVCPYLLVSYTLLWCFPF